MVTERCMMPMDMIEAFLSITEGPGYCFHNVDLHVLWCKTFEMICHMREILETRNYQKFNKEHKLGVPLF